MEMHAVKMRGTIACVFLLVISLSFSVNGVDVSFNLKEATNATYKTFIQQFRTRLTVGTTPSNGLPVLRSASSIPDNQRFIVVTLTPYDSGKTIGIVIDLSNVYVIGFNGNNHVYFLDAIPKVNYSNLFVGVKNRTNLTYAGSYDALERPPVGPRGKIPLGLNELDAAITNLWYPDQTKYRKALIVIIQMVSEAARFKGIESEFANNFLLSQGPSTAVQSLEKNWGALSSAIQSSVDGEFKNPVTVENTAGTAIQIKNVAKAKSLTGIALLQG